MLSEVKIFFDWLWDVEIAFLNSSFFLLGGIPVQDFRFLGIPKTNLVDLDLSMNKPFFLHQGFVLPLRRDLL